jgi:hypothetical protein
MNEEAFLICLEFMVSNTGIFRLTCQGGNLTMDAFIGANSFSYWKQIPTIYEFMQDAKDPKFFNGILGLLEGKSLGGG